MQHSATTGLTAARPIGLTAVLLAGLAATAAPSQAAGFDPLTAYGDALVFEIRRAGSAVGEHRVTFSGPPADLRVTARSDIAVSFLGFTVHRFRYESESRWRHDRPVRYSAVTDDGGTVTRVERAGGLDLYPTDHWHPGVIGATAVLNTITGTDNRVAMVREARETVPTPDGPRPATRYAYRGELEALVWYDDAGRWVGLRFTARDGSVIDYVCRRCGPAAGVAEGS